MKGEDRRSPIDRVRHALSWRLASLRGRIRSQIPAFPSVLRELRCVTGRSAVDLARDLLDAWRSFDLDAHDFATYMLWEIPRERWREYVVGNELKAFLERTLDGDDRVLSRDKAAFAQHDRAKGLPWLRTLAVINRREGVAIDGAAVVENEPQLWSVLDDLRRGGDLVAKPSCGERGKGFFCVSRDGVVRDETGAAIDRRVIARTVLTYTHRLGNFGYLVQSALTSHPEMVELTGIDTLSSVRIVTALADGKPHVIESFLKIPGSGRLIDNFLSGSRGTMIARFDPRDGRLANATGLIRPGFRHVLESVSVHPTTRKQIAGRTLPLWRDALDIAFRASMSHPRSAAIGWDVALSSQGCVIIDGNPNWGPGWEPCAPEGVRTLLARLYPADFA
jgi:hypothetical protein